MAFHLSYLIQFWNNVTKSKTGMGQETAYRGRLTL